MNKLIPMLQKAHSGELAAYYAYEGHWRSVSNKREKVKIRRIQRDELHHAQVVAKMLTFLGAKPNLMRDIAFITLGRILSVLCYVTGWLLPMKGALLIEKIGAASYWDTMDVAILEGQPNLALSLMFMASKEEKHKEYFEGLLNAKTHGHTANKRTNKSS